MDLRRKWSSAVTWLNEELERRPYGTNTQYGYNNWSPPAQSNETSNGYYLERSHSARVTLARAHELCPPEEAQEELEEHEMSEDTDSPPPETIADNSNEVRRNISVSDQTKRRKKRLSEMETNEGLVNESKINEFYQDFNNKWWSGVSTEHKFHETMPRNSVYSGNQSHPQSHPQACPASPTHTADPEMPNKLFPWINNTANNSSTKIKPMTSPPKFKTMTTGWPQQQMSPSEGEPPNETENSQQNSVFNSKKEN
jgi:hypothetical protein